MMTLRHLYIFKTVCETKNFTKAAQKLYITQSAVSHAIRELCLLYTSVTHTRMDIIGRISLLKEFMASENRCV